MTTHPTNKFVQVTVCRARGLLSRDTKHAVAPITSEGLEIFVVASSTRAITAEELRLPSTLLEPRPERAQLLRTPAVASTPVNPNWSDSERCRFTCPVAAAPLVFDVWGATLSRELFLGRATLRPEALLRAADTVAAGLADEELRLELLPREDEDDPVILGAVEKFFTGLGLLVVSVCVVDAPPPPAAPEPPMELIDITVPRLDVLSPSKRPPLAPALVDVPHAHQVRPGLADVTQDMQDAAVERELRDPALPLHVAQMVEISLLNCSQVVATWLSELRAVASLLAPGRPPPPPPPKFEIIAEAFGGTFSSGLLSTNVEDLTQQRQSALPLFSVYGSVCAAADAKIPLRLRFVDATDLVNAEKEASRSEVTSSASASQQSMSTSFNNATGSAGATSQAGKPLHNGREVFAETLVPGVPVPDPEQQHGANSVSPESAAGIVGNRVVMPVRFNDRLGGASSSNKAAVELAVKSVSAVPAKSVTESGLFHGKGLFKIEVREARDLLTPHMIAAAVAAARGPSVGSLRATGGLGSGGGSGSFAGGGASGSVYSYKSAVSKSSRRSGGSAVVPPAARPAAGGREDSGSRDGSNSPEQQQQQNDNDDAASDTSSNRTAATTRTTKSGIPSQYAAAAANAAAVAAQPPDPVYCEVAIKERLDDVHLKVLGKSPFVPAEGDAFFGFTATVELDRLRQLPEAVVVSIYQSGAVIARSVVHVMERRSIDGTWATLKPPVRKGVSQGDGLRGMVWVRWVATPQQQQQQATSNPQQQEREQALSYGSAVAPARWIRSDALVPDLVRSPAAPHGACEMLLGDTAPPYASAASRALRPHELGYREAGALCIDWNAVPVGYCLRIRQGARTVFGPALRVQRMESTLKAPPVVVFLEGTVDGAPPLVFETFRCPEEGAPLVVRQSDRVYERKCWLPVDVNALQHHPPAVAGTDALTTSTTGIADAFEGSFLTHLNTMLNGVVGSSSSSNLFGSSDNGSSLHSYQLRRDNNNKNKNNAELPQHPPCFTVALDEIAAINIACRWVPLVKKMPPPPPIVRSRSRSPETPASRRAGRDGCSEHGDGDGDGGDKKKKYKKPPMPLRIAGPGFPPLLAELQDEEDTLEKIAPLVERHFGIAAKDQVFFQGKLRLMGTGRPQAAGTGSRQQAKHHNNVLPVVRRLAGEGEDKALPVTDLSLSNRDARAICLTVKLPCGLVVPLAVPHQTNVAMLRALLKQAVVDRKLLDPATGDSLDDAVASVNRLCHLNKILRDDSSVRNLGLRPEVPLIAMSSGPAVAVAPVVVKEVSEQQSKNTLSIGGTPEDPAVGTGRQSPPPIAPLGAAPPSKQQQRAPLTPAMSNPQKSVQQRAQQQVQQRPMMMKENNNAGGKSSPQQRHNIPPIQMMDDQQHSSPPQNQQQQQEIEELRAKLQQANSRINELESTVERQRVLLRRVAQSM